MKFCFLLIQKIPRELTEQLGVDVTYKPEDYSMLCDVCIEDAGNFHALLQCYTHANINALIIQVGTIAEKIALPANVVMSKELTIKGVFRYKHVFTEVLDFLLFKASLKKIIIYTVELKIQVAFDT